MLEILPIKNTKKKNTHAGEICKTVFWLSKCVKSL